jgi:membrane-associated phospholipid phosphatase
MTSRSISPVLTALVLPLALLCVAGSAARGAEVPAAVPADSASAQDKARDTASDAAVGASVPAAIAESVPGSGAFAVAGAEPSGRHESGFVRFMKDVGGDYKHFFSKETAWWYAGGLGTAGLVHLADEEIAEALADPPQPTQTALEGGDKYGNLTYQLPLAVGWWITGHAMGSSRGAAAGRDLLRAQINATTWAYAIKYAVGRTRPNGDPRSFPSGHATAVFATAMVLQEHYGWKVGVPFFAAATYTAISRITVNKHWASDVTFGAFVGMASARTVTLHVRNQKFTLAPLPARGGGGVAFVRVN